MSELLVQVTKIDEVKKHSNADKLELVEVKGWQVVVGKGEFKVGEEIVFIPTEAVLPLLLSDELNVTKYLHKGRVKSVKLRGEYSHGIVTKNKWGFALGENVAQKLGIVKYEEVEFVDNHKPKSFLRKWLWIAKSWIGLTESLKAIPEFHKYTDIQNWRHYPYIFEDGEGVVVTEKIHGTNSRVGYIKGWLGGKWLVGSHNQRKRISLSDIYSIPIRGALGTMMKAMIRLIQQHYGAKIVIVFGEIYGGQDLKYGLSGYSKYRVFDISVDGKYLDWLLVSSFCEYHSIDTVPILAMAKYSKDLPKKMAEGKTTLTKDNPHMREGVVIKPMSERYKDHFGRVVLKYLSDEYLARKEGTEFH